MPSGAELIKKAKEQITEVDPSEVHEVMGPYDIVAEIEMSSLQDIPGLLQEQIRNMEGIQSTTSLVAFPA